MIFKTKLKFTAYVALLCLCCISPLYAQVAYTPEDAIKHIGEIGTVCGMVASTHYATRSKGQPTFINLDRPYPNHIFTVLIWGSDRHKFPAPPEQYYSNKKICVTGTIKQFKGTPEIIVKDPSQIK